MNLTTTLPIVPFVLAWSSCASAFETIPDKSGFSGYLLFGGSYVNTSSNMLAGTKTTDLTSTTTDSLTETPAGHDSLSATLLGEVRYTFAGQRTQLFAGQLLTDFIQYDVTDLAGVRHEFASLGIIGASYVFSGIVTTVWKDPYVVNAERADTKREMSGGRLSWEKLFDTRVSIQYTIRNIELDELSGTTQLSLSGEEAGRLNRNGDLHELRLSYEAELNEHHTLTPEIIYDNADLIGQAMAAERYGIKLLHTYIRKERGMVLATAGSYTEADYNEVNPVYNETRNEQRYGLEFTYMQFGLFKNYQSQIAVLTNLHYFKEDANLDFYDTRIYGVTLSLFYRF
ncbi:MAG: DUF2860 domain-containing protein [Gammaproteobacteria bacterium]|nr:DUF2860 domain-containing protein [Gammaproteobacteria bacterium]